LTADPLKSGTDNQPEDNDQGTKEKRETAHYQKSASTPAFLPEAGMDEGRTDAEKDNRAEQRKILREWLTIFGLFLAAAAAIYQGVILSKQADTLNGQLIEMGRSAVQTDKLIQSNADLAAAAKAQAIAEQSIAATTHDNLIMSERARISSLAATLENIEAGQILKARVTYANFGREPAPTDYAGKMRKWPKSDWLNGNAITELKNITDECLGYTDVHGMLVAYPSSGPGNGYAFAFDSGGDSKKDGSGFVADDSITKGDTVAVVTSCFVYKTVSEIHHTASCYYYLANKTPSVATPNICADGNAVD
jgi:hypothetical protein